MKFVDNGMLTMTRCSCCGGHFVTHPHEIARHYVCGLCNPPARAGKGRATGSLRLGPVRADEDDASVEEHAPANAAAELLLRSAKVAQGMICA